MKIHLYSNEQWKKKYPNYTIRKTSELEKKYLYSKEWFNKKKKKSKDSPKDIYFVNDIERHWNKGFQNVNCILHIIIIFTAQNWDSLIQYTAQNRDSLIQYTYTCTNISHEWYYAD